MATSAWLISQAALQPSIAALEVSVVAVRFFGISRGVLRYRERLISHDTTFRLLAEWRVRLFHAMEPLVPVQMAGYRSGDLLARLVSDVESLQEFYLRAVAPPLVALLTSVVVLLFFGMFDPLIAIVLLTFLITAGVGLPCLVWWKGQRFGAALVTARADLHAALLDSIQGMADSLIYGQNHMTQEVVNRVLNRMAVLEWRLGWLDSMQLALGILAVNGAALSVLIVAIPRVNSIYLATLALAAVAVFEAITPLAQTATQLSRGLGAVQRLFSIIDRSPGIAVDHQPSPVPKDYSLCFNHVSFRYNPADLAVFDDLTFTVRAGQRVALLGPSGSGKSTLVNLLVRFWEPQAGSIMLGGYDLRQYDPEQLRQMIGVMSQRTHVFNTTLRENIRLARPSASDDDVEHAARLAEVHDAIMALPGGYESDAGEDGNRLSSGECQRIALARVLLKDAPVLVLDEPTAYLDAITERAIWENILRVSAGQTLIVLTHRLLFAERFDACVQLAG